MDDIKAKQQFIDKIKESNNILVTVSDSPSVDALSAAIGFTLLLDKMDKYATAVFSGTVPPAIAFLEPDKVLDDTTDSLRDFIIALDKEKADHLRYKVEGDSVKIFITPYKTTISSDDLEFSQGDYNVELVVAVGVDDQKHLDKALESHGQILHDATVVTVTAGEQTSTLGGIDWHDDQATSLSEMMSSLAEALKPEKNKSLIDSEIATAFLTGIVAQTDRFSNSYTTARVMTIASQLMAAGADQQLIVTKLEADYEIQPQADEETPDEQPQEEAEEVSTDGTLHITQHDKTPKKVAPKKPVEEPVEVAPEPEEPSKTEAAPESFETLEELDERVKAKEQAEAAKAAQQALDATQPTTDDYISTPMAEPSLPQLEDTEPTMGGTLNATTEQAAEEAREEAENNQNKTILQHSYLGPSPSTQQSVGLEEPSTTEPSGSAYLLGNDEPVVQPMSPVQPQGVPSPTDVGLPMPPPLPDFSQLATTPTGPYAPPSQSAILGDILAPETPTQPPLPPPTQPEQSFTPTGPYAPPETPPPPAPDDPGQFKIPGQQ